MLTSVKQNNILLTDNINSKNEFRNGLLLALLCSLSLFMEERIFMGFETLTGISGQVVVWSVRFVLMFTLFNVFVFRGFSRKLVHYQVFLFLLLIVGLVNLDILLLPVYLAKYLWLGVNFSLIYLVSKSIKREKTLLLSLIIPIMLFGSINAVLIYDNDIKLFSSDMYVHIFRILSAVPLSFSFGMLLLTFKRPVLFFLTTLFFLFVYVSTAQRTGALIVVVCFFVLGKYKAFFANNNIKFLALTFTLVTTLTIAFMEYEIHWNGSIGTGRGNIWGHWIISLFESPKTLLFGFGPTEESSFLRIVEQGDKIFNWKITQFTHSGFIALLATGGLVKFSLFFLLVKLMMIKKAQRCIISSGLFHVSLLTIMTSSLNGFFTSDFYGFAFTLSFFVAPMVISGKNIVTT